MDTKKTPYPDDEFVPERTPYPDKEFVPERDKRLKYQAGGELVEATGSELEILMIRVADLVGLPVGVAVLEGAIEQALTALGYTRLETLSGYARNKVVVEAALKLRATLSK